MGAVADGALGAGGEVIGVIIPGMNTLALAHQGLTRMDVAAEMHARKARMHELADGYVALPGGYGTFDELFEAITWGQIGAHAKPVGLLNVRDYFSHMLKAIDHAVQEGFIFPEHRASLRFASDPDVLLDSMAAYEHPHAAVKRWLREE
jgi:uncharacterized protein (TIGR00730 family)